MYRIDPPPPEEGFIVELSIVLPTHGHGDDAGHSGLALLETEKNRFKINEKIEIMYNRLFIKTIPNL